MHRTLVAVLCDARDAAQQQRVVHDEQLRAALDRLVDGVENGIDGELDAGDLVAGSPDSNPGASQSSASSTGQSAAMAAFASARVEVTAPV